MVAMTFATMAEALAEAVRGGRLADMIPNLQPERRAMLCLWYGSTAEVLESAEVITDFLRPSFPDDVPRQWIVDGVLWNSGHRPLMKSIPSLAAELISINGSPYAFTVMWDVGQHLTNDVAGPAWIDAKAALRAGGWIK
jgi:hypothetical protein